MPFLCSTCMQPQCMSNSRMMASCRLCTLSDPYLIHTVQPHMAQEGPEVRMGQDVILRHPGHNLHEQGPSCRLNCAALYRCCLLRCCLPNSSTSDTWYAHMGIACVRTSVLLPRRNDADASGISEDVSLHSTLHGSLAKAAAICTT